MLRSEYTQCKNYTEISNKYNLHYAVVMCLIKYGTPAYPKCYTKGVD